MRVEVSSVTNGLICLEQGVIRSSGRRWKLVFAVALLLSSASSGCSNPPNTEAEIVTQENDSRFTTYYGLGPDKWASAWLIQRHIQPAGKVRILPAGTTVEAQKVNWFDTATADYRRTKDSSTYQSLIEKFEIADPVVLKIGAIIHDMEVNLWRPDEWLETIAVERGFRDLQNSYQRDLVPDACYLAFFQRLEHALRNNVPLKDWNRSTLIPDKDCGKEPIKQLNAKNHPVHQIAINDMLDVMRSGAKVVFVDARELEEYDESHIPGAIHMPIRLVSHDRVKPLLDADIVVAYCVKDFRGYELAMTLNQYGIENTAILKPYGFKGWISEGLPTTGGHPEEVATRKLQDCVERQPSCKARL
ncbi:MAG: hypothetical protein GY820_16105 [Gammaproteobacteria bacterium]|nr:hypothetical protein [Gammaproteobacteria bacterium]